MIGEARRFLERADWRTVNQLDLDGVNRETRRLSFVTYPGDFTCIDAAAPNEYDEVFSLVIPAPGGPSLDKIISVDVSANTAVMACGVTASSPMASLRESDVDKRALLTRDSVTRRWHILLYRDGAS